MRFHRTILVVEDDPNDQIFILEAFRSIGVENPIRVVSSGSEAIAYLKGAGKYSDRSQYTFPAFIITDLKMLGGSGFSVLEHLQANPELSIIPKVVFSSSEDPDDIKRAYLLGASCYLQKPQGQTELCKHLQILHDFWMLCKVPETDEAGRLIQTESRGKLGEKFKQPSGTTQKRARP